MDSKEVLETFGISKNFGIVLLIQSIIVIVGCFFAIQAAYLMDINGNVLFSFKNILNVLFFIALLVYSFYAYRKNENYFKWVLYLYALLLIVTLVAGILSGIWVGVLFQVIKLIIILYLILNLSSYPKAKISVLLLIIVELINLFYVFMNGSSLGILAIINLIPCVSIALTYFARYNDKGFKILL